MGVGSYDLFDLVRPLGERAGRRFPAAATRLRRLLYDLRLLAGDRLWIFVAVDLFLLAGPIFQSLLDGQRLGQLYGGVVVVPALLLGVPLLSRLVAVERRAGSLDLALAAPSTPRYFLRRAAAAGWLLWIQSVLLLCLVYVENRGGPAAALAGLPDHGGELGRAVVQATLVMALLLSVSLFWAVRLRSTGAVMVASGFTLYAFNRWTLRSPALEWEGLFLGMPRSVLGWMADQAFLVAAVVIFFLYARERLRRPHQLLD